MKDVNLSTVLGYVLDRTDLPMKDCASLQLVCRSTNAVVCSQFYPHVQSVARLVLTDRMVARAVQLPQDFFRRFPVMKDLHVPWNPPTIDASAAISITQACQLLTDYPQIRSLPPVYLEREGLEGLGGHSLQSVTFYPGSHGREVGEPTESRDELNPAAGKFEVEQVEIVSNYETKEDNVLVVSSQIDMQNEAVLMQLLGSNNLKTLRQFLQIKEATEKEPQCSVDGVLRFDCMENITNLSIWFKHNMPIICLRLFDPKTKIEYTSVKTLHLERVHTESELVDEKSNPSVCDVVICDFVLRSFPNLEKLIAPRSGMMMDFDPCMWAARPGRMYSQLHWQESGIMYVAMNFDRCVQMDIVRKVQNGLFATKTVKRLSLVGHLLSMTDLKTFIDGFPKLEALLLADACPLVNDELFTILAKANIRSLKLLNLEGTSCSVKGIRKYIVWRHRQIELLKKEMSFMSLIVPSGPTSHEVERVLKQIPRDVIKGANICLLTQ